MKEVVNILLIIALIIACILIFPVESLKENNGVISSIEYKESTNDYETEILFVLTNYGGIDVDRTFKLPMALNVGDTVVFDSYGFINISKIKEIKLSRLDKRYFIFDLHGDDFEVLDDGIGVKLKPGDDLYLRLKSSDDVSDTIMKTEIKKQHNNFVE